MEDSITISIRKCDVVKCNVAAEDHPVCSLKGYTKYRKLKLKETRDLAFCEYLYDFYTRWIIKQSLVDLGIIIAIRRVVDYLGVEHMYDFADYILKLRKKGMHYHNFGWTGWIIDFKKVPKMSPETGTMNIDIFHYKNMVPKWYYPNNNTTFPDGFYNTTQEPFRYLCMKHKKKVLRDYRTRLCKILKKLGVEDCDDFIERLHPMMFYQTISIDWKAIKLDNGEWIGKWIYDDHANIFDDSCSDYDGKLIKCVDDSNKKQKKKSSSGSSKKQKKKLDIDSNKSSNKKQKKKLDIYSSKSSNKKKKSSSES